jgi:hypothetical protein
MVCAVCALPLDALVLPGKPEEYIHIQDIDLDHPAVPVPAGDVRTRLRCDFCNGEPAVWRIVADDFPMPQPQSGGHSVGDWAACAECGKLIGRDRWIGLASRVHRSLPVNLRHRPVSDLEAVYERLRAHMHGMEPLA